MIDRQREGVSVGWQVGGGVGIGCRSGRPPKIRRHHRHAHAGSQVYHRGLRGEIEKRGRVERRGAIRRRRRTAQGVMWGEGRQKREQLRRQYCAKHWHAWLRCHYAPILGQRVTVVYCSPVVMCNARPYCTVVAITHHTMNNRTDANVRRHQRQTFQREGNA